jgi:putative flippase GtrA
VVGTWNTLFGYGVWAVLQYMLHPYLNYLFIIVLSYPIAIANAYVCYRYIVFRSHGSVLRELPRFSSVYLLTMAANLVALPFLLRVLPFNLYVIQALFTAAVVVASYVGHKFFSFRGGQVKAGGHQTTTLGQRGRE